MLNVCSTAIPVFLEIPLLAEKKCLFCEAAGDFGWIKTVIQRELYLISTPPAAEEAVVRALHADAEQGNGAAPLRRFRRCVSSLVHQPDCKFGNIS